MGITSLLIQGLKRQFKLQQRSNVGGGLLPIAEGQSMMV
ncbi:hypothetical protein C4J91_4439 [Pseudomonas sp. R3-52-08]|nr:hypothetical protein C4J91_4439 [Pseudomonas sp. R3-52-08]